MNNPVEPPSLDPDHKQPKMLLFDSPHARNGGNFTSFVNTSNTNIMDTTFGSTTDEEDDDETEQHYLNKMTDDTDRKVETVFGKGVDVWKSFNGTVYADVNDRIKKQRRDEEVWGKKKEKRKRDTVGKEKDKELLEQLPDSLRNSKSSGSTSTSTWTPGFTPSTDSDGTVSYPSSLPSNNGYQMSFPRTPTASEWDIFPVRQSQYNDFSGTPLEYKSLNNSHRPINPLPTRAQWSRDARPTSSTRYQTTVPHLYSPSPQSLSAAAPPPPTDVLGNTLGGARRIVSGSFGSFDGGQVD